MTTYTYKATVIKVIDGDTVDLLVDLGFRTRTEIRTRLLGINAPEVSTPEGVLARDWLRKMLPINTKVEVETFKYPGDKYGRWLAHINAPGVGDVAEMMLSTGHAVTFMVAA